MGGGLGVSEGQPVGLQTRVLMSSRDKTTPSNRLGRLVEEGLQGHHID